MSEKKYDIETEMALLRQEMKQTREVIKKYNGLREDLGEVNKRVTILETKESAGRGAANSTREWILFAIIIAQLIFQLIPKFVG